MRYGIGATLLIIALAAACAKSAKAPEGILFKDDLAFLQTHTKVVVLKGTDGQAQVAVNPDLQGRVMTSTADGAGRPELRLDQPGAPGVRRQQSAHQRLRRRGPLLARPGGRPVLDLLQEGRPLRPRPLVDAAGRQRRGLRRRFAGRGPDPLPQGHPPRELLGDGRSTSRSTGRSGCSARPTSRPSACPCRPASGWSPTPPNNSITNLGAAAWTKDTGLLSIWILGMFNPSPATTIVIPFKTGPGGRARPGRQRRLLRQGPGRPPGRQGERGRPVLQRRRQVPEQDRHLPGPGQALRRELRRRERRPDPRPPDRPGGRDGLRQLDVGDPGEALRRGRRQQLQRRPGRAGRQAARARSTSSRRRRRPRPSGPAGP